MKKISLIATLLSVILLLENCKKDTVIASANSTYYLIANINDSTWNTDSTNAIVTYNTANQSKVFTCSGTVDNKQIQFSLTKPISSNTSGFPLGTYTVDATSNLLMEYLTPKPNSTVYTPNGIVKPGAGTVTITTVDSVKSKISGSFSFNTVQNNYDSNGNIVSVSVNTIAAGGFNSMPYTFKTK
ncbi:DUF6252 family protein [Mucilaginibacter sp.]|uniref:DUF6252 family protein n=1 Tax=Mucilaginibacter sp. TaxID=1882438 RepID=UPI003D0B99F4